MSVVMIADGCSLKSRKVASAQKVILGTVFILTVVSLESNNQILRFF